MLQLAKRLALKEHIFLLGKGYGEPIAYEGALKLKEMAYIHAEGYRYTPRLTEAGLGWVSGCMSDSALAHHPVLACVDFP